VGETHGQTINHPDFAEAMAGEANQHINKPINQQISCGLSQSTAQQINRSTNQPIKKPPGFPGVLIFSGTG